MLVAAHTQLELRAADRARERARRRLEVLIESGDVHRRAYRKALAALHIAFDAFQAAQRRDSFWYEAHKRRLRRRLDEVAPRNHVRTQVLAPYGVAERTFIVCGCGWSCQADNLASALSTHDGHAKRAPAGRN